MTISSDTIYVTELPVCHECAKAIIQVGIKKVYYDTPIDTNPNWSETGKLALEMFAEAGIICEFVERIQLL